MKQTKLTQEIEPEHVHDDALASKNVVLDIRHPRLLPRAKHKGTNPVGIAEAHNANTVDHRLPLWPAINASRTTGTSGARGSRQARAVNIPSSEKHLKHHMLHVERIN